MNNENSIDKAAHRQKRRGRKVFWMVSGVLFVLSLVWTVDGFRHDSDRSFLDFRAIEQRLDRVLEALNADQEQRAVLEPLVLRLQSEVAQMRVEEAALRNELSDVLDSGTFEPVAMARLQEMAVSLGETAITTAFQAMGEA